MARISFVRIFTLLSVIFVFGFLHDVVANESESEPLNPKVISIDPGLKEYQRLLAGPPETVTMRSGLVVLEPGKSVGIHNTEKYEEVVILLEGEGQMVITDGPKLELKPNSVAYCPPNTEHNVTNTGQGLLRYIYIVAIAL